MVAKILGVLSVAVLAGAGIARGGQVFDVKQYGAVGDGKTMDTAAIQKAIDAASAVKGTVLLGPGKYLSGSLNLKSGITFQVDKGATLLGSTSRMDYRKLAFHGLLLADGQQDITLCGQGTIDGQGKALSDDTVRLWKEKKLPDAAEGQRPVIINFRNCRNVVVRDITLRQSACWVQHYLNCDNLTIEKITVRSNATINNDGIDVDGCTRTVVRDCDIDAEDDAICLKSSRRACDDVLVENCRFRSTCNALKFGTGSAGGFKNITCRDLTIYDTYISGIALEIVDGGTMENVRISKVKMTDTNNPLFIRLGHRNVQGTVGKVSGVTISDVTAEIPVRSRDQMNKFPEGWRHRCMTLITGSITGLPGHPVQDVTLKNIAITYGGIGGAPKPDHLRLDKLHKVPERAENYPESQMFGVLPAWGFYVRHAEGIRFDNVTIRVKGSDYRAALVCDDVKNISLDEFRVLSAGSEPVIVLKDVQGATIRNSPPPAGAKTFLQTLGNTTDVKTVE